MKKTREGGGHEKSEPIRFGEREQNRWFQSGSRQFFKTDKKSTSKHQGNLCQPEGEVRGDKPSTKDLGEGSDSTRGTP